MTGRDSGAPEGLDVYTQSLDCVHCGLCLTACPTYRATGRESSSPRGRVYLMRGAAEGRIPLEGLLAEEAFLCLGCRACETACPSGVQYGEMLERTREAVVDAGLRRGAGARLESWLLRRVVPDARRLHRLVGALALLQRSHLDRLGLRLLAALPGAESLAAELRELHALLPRIPPASERTQLPLRVAARGEHRGRVALFTGCVMSELFGRVHQATLRVLTRNGFEVWVPRDQGCCGALLEHSGDRSSARALALRNARTLGELPVDAVILNSAGCGAAMRDSAHWIGEEGRALADKVRDVSEFLVDAGLRAPEATFDARVCYDDPCHLVHAQGIARAPRAMLGAIPGLRLVPHAEAEACCGAAGIYSVTHREMSARVLARKLDSLEAAAPDFIATGNPGCLMQLEGGVRARGLAAEVVHPVELLDRAYALEGSPTAQR